MKILLGDISTGVYGYPKEKAAVTAADAFKRAIDSGYDGAIIVCCFLEEDYDIYKRFVY